MKLGFEETQSPYSSGSQSARLWTEVIERDGDAFVVYWSPKTAEHQPDYRELGRFSAEEQARAFIKLYC